MKGYMLSQSRVVVILCICLGVISASWISFKSDENKGLLVQQSTQTLLAQNKINTPSPVEQDDSSSSDEFSDEVYLPYVQVFFDPFVKSLLTAQVSAPIVSINKRMGDSFEANDTLIQLYDVVYKASIGKAEGLLNKAQIGLTAKLQLFEDKVASLFDVADLEAAVATALSDLAAANYLYDCCTIDVPYPGYVAAVLVNDFETPQVGQPLIEVVDTRVLLAKMLFDSSYIDHIFVGQKIKIAVKEIGETVEGNIIRIAPVIDPASAKFKVEAEVPNVGGKIRPGMSGKITLKTLKVAPSQIPNGGSVR
jgi:membrane fusion protein (multidrug efflux system)